MVMRIGGLASGMDIDALVEKLMNAERAPLNKLTQKKQTYEWQRDAYRSVNTKLKTFDTYIADNLVLKTLNSKTSSSSNSSLVSATATGKATGTLSIEGVSQLATAARGLGNQINAAGPTKLSALGIDTSSEFKISAIDSQGKLVESVGIKLDDNMTVDQFVSKINSSNAGVSAIFEGGRLSITAKNTGKEVNGQASMSTDAAGTAIFSKLGLAQLVTEEGKNAIFQVNGIATERTSNSFSINGYNVTLSSTFNGEKTNAEKYNSAYTEWKNTSSLDFNNQITDALNAFNSASTEYTTADSSYTSARDGLFGVSVSAKSIYDSIGSKTMNKLATTDLSSIRLKGFSDDAAYQSWLNDDTTDASLKATLKAGKVTFEKFNSLKALQETELQSMQSESKYNTLGASFLGGLNSAQQDLINDSLQKGTAEEFKTQIDTWKNSLNVEEKALGEKLAKLSDSQKNTLREMNNTELSNLSSLAEKYNDAQAKLKDKNTKEADHKALVDRQAAAPVNFKAAYKEQNGTETGYENATAIAPDDIPESSIPPVTLTSTTNVDDMMNKIKEFVATYNGLIKDLNDQTKESKYRDYAPLTAEQKKDMDENEIKLWEEKAKSGLLRNDSIIRNGLSNMRSLIYQTNPAIEDSKYNTLFSIGITTSKSYNEGGTLEIDEAKLRKAIEENPDAVEKLFKNSEGNKEDVVDGKTVDTRGYLQKLRESMKSFEINIDKKAGRSTMTDSQYAIGKSLIDNEKRIDTWQLKLKNIEARYWKQFSAMETAINKANQQSSMFFQGQQG